MPVQTDIELAQMLNLQSKNFFQPRRTSHKIIHTYKRKRFSIHPDSSDVEKDNLLFKSPSTAESSRDVEQASETNGAEVEPSKILYNSAEDHINSQLEILHRIEDISIKSKVDFICQRKAPMFTFSRRTKRKVDSTENNSNLEMQEVYDRPVEVNKAEIFQENSKESSLLSDRNKRRRKRKIEAAMKNSNLEVREGDNLPVEVNEPEICTNDSTRQSSLLSDQHKRRRKIGATKKSNLDMQKGGKLPIEVSEAEICAEDSTQRSNLCADHHSMRTEEPSLASVSSLLMDSQLASKDRLNCSSSDSVKNLSTSICPEKLAIMVYEDHQVTSGRISSEDQVSAANLLLLCRACDNIAEGASKDKESHQGSVKVNNQQVSDEREKVHQMSKGFSLPDLNSQVSLPAEETCFQIHEETESQRALSIPDLTLPQQENRLILPAPLVSNYNNQQTDQTNDFLQPRRAYNWHSQTLSNVLASSETIFNRQNVDHLTSFRSQPAVWSAEELDSLWIGVRRHGAGNWARMLMDSNLTFGQRTPEDLARRWGIEQTKFLNSALPLSMSVPEVNGYPNCFSRNGNRLSSGDSYFQKVLSQSQHELTTVYPLVTNGNLASGSSMYTNIGPSMSSKPANVTHSLRGEASTSDWLTLACGSHVEQRVSSTYQREESSVELNLGLPEPMVSERLVAVDEDSSGATISDDEDGWHQLLP